MSQHPIERCGVVVGQMRTSALELEVYSKIANATQDYVPLYLALGADQLEAPEQRRLELERELEEAKHNYIGACQTINAMHAAAMGPAGGMAPLRDVVGDVRDVREALGNIVVAANPYLLWSGLEGGRFPGLALAIRTAARLIERQER